MTSIDFVLLYVSDVSRSVAFWADVLGGRPVDEAPTFAMFVLPNGTRLGLWLARDVDPAATAPGGSEIAVTVSDAAAVDATCAAWAALDRPILQAPTTMDFGRTFTSADPDGHRVRVFAPSRR